MRAASLLAICGWALAALPLSAQVDHLAISYDGNVVVTGGRNRVVYEHDAQTLKVVKRTRVNQPIQDLALNRDGSLLFVADGAFDPEFTIRDRPTGRVLKSLPRVSVLGGFASNSGIFATSIISQRLCYRIRERFFVISMADGSPVAEIQHDGEDPYRVALNPSGDMLVVVTRGLPNDEEQDDKPPATDNDLEKALHRERHDGKGSRLYAYDVKTGQRKATWNLWYSADEYSNAIVGFAPGEMLILTYGNVNARIRNATDVTLFSLVNFGYGMGISPDGRYLASGSMLESGKIVELKTGQETQLKGAPHVPGFPEYYHARLAFDEHQRLFGLTTGVRIFRINEAQEMSPIEPIY